MKRQQPRSTLSVLTKPLALAVLSISGLVLGLTGDGWRDVFAVLLLALPLILFLTHWARRSRRAPLVRK
jgi:hypothetical protein